MSVWDDFRKIIETKWGDFATPKVISPLGSNFTSPTPTPDPFEQIGYTKTGNNSYSSISNQPKNTSDLNANLASQQINPQTAMGRNPAISKFKIAPEVHSAFEQAANQYKLPKSLLYDIALQENSFNAKGVNTTPEGIAAGNPTGLFQFTDDTWDTVRNYAQKPGSSLKLSNFDREDALTSALAAAYLIKFGQLGRWDASKFSWGQYYTPEELESYYSQTLGR